MKRLFFVMLGVLVLLSVRGQSARAGLVRLELRQLYVDSGLLWVVLHAANYSAIDFRAAAVRFSIRDRHALKRRALQEQRLSPVAMRDQPPVLRSDSSATFYYGLVPRIPSKSQELIVEWVERDGDRRLQLHVPASAILKARKL